MVKKDSEADLITLTEAAELRDYKDVSAISHLVKRGRLRSVERYGKTLVYRADVLAFEPDKGGRPPKAKSEKQVSQKKGRKKQ